MLHVALCSLNSFQMTCWLAIDAKAGTVTPTSWKTCLGSPNSWAARSRTTSTTGNTITFLCALTIYQLYLVFITLISSRWQISSLSQSLHVCVGVCVWLPDHFQPLREIKDPLYVLSVVHLANNRIRKSNSQTCAGVWTPDGPHHGCRWLDFAYFFFKNSIFSFYKLVKV